MRPPLPLPAAPSRLIMALAMLLSLAGGGGPASAELIDRVVASAGNEVITLSELQQAVAFNEAVAGAPGRGARDAAETLEGLINRRLLLQEAYRLRNVEVSEQDTAAELARFRERLGAEEAFRGFLSRTGLTEENLGRLLGERLLVERFVEKKIGIFARVSRDEAEQYFRERPDEFRNRRFPEVQKQIMILLSVEKTAQQLDLYIADLRSRSDIRVNPLLNDRPAGAGQDAAGGQR